MTTEVAQPWTLNGTVLIACNCDWGCPCNFNAPPTPGFCEGGWTWHIDKGAFGPVTLDGLNFTLCVKWPGAIHLGNGEAVLFIDERADEGQARALATLVGGKVGGPWGILGWTWPTLHGPTRVAYELVLDGVRSHVKVGEAMHLALTTIKNPVTGAEARPGIVLPEGLIVKAADLGASATFCLHGAIDFDHSGKYAAIGQFAYAGQ